jgi:DNA-binding NtrC family response regulator
MHRSSTHDRRPQAREVPRSILIVDDDQVTCEAMELTLSSPDREIVWRTSAHDALKLVAERDFDTILTDLAMPMMGGIELCERLRALRPDMPVLVVTGHKTIEAAVSAIRACAYDFVVKPVDEKVLTLAVDRAVQHRRLRDEVKRLRLVVSPSDGKMIGESPAMKAVFDLVARLAPSDASVLVTGESGTGKELIARALHDQSARKDGPFLALNCAAVPAALLESELFGHARGAFTDAKTARTGLFVEASGGTLFLDEIGELPLELQPKLLRALQERKARRIGESVETAFDTRIVTATNRDLDAEVREKRFREDLFYRINVVRVEAPPLRVRGNDVLLLAQSLLQRFAQKSGKAVRGITAEAAAKLSAYEWPGNVRELENCMERAIALVRFDEVTVDDLPERLRQYRIGGLVASADEPSEVVTLDELARRYTKRVLAAVGGNKSRAAELLGVHRRTLYRWLERAETYSAGERGSDRPTKGA